MNTRRLVVVGITAILSAGVCAAQDTADIVQQSMAEYSAWIDVMVEFTRGVEFDEGDMQSFLAHWEDMNALPLGDEDHEGSAETFRQDVQEVLADPRYRTWATSNGLDPEGWMKSSMRIATVIMRQTMDDQSEMMASQRAEYEAMIEQQCAQVDPEACRQMRSAMEASMAMGEAMLEASRRLPSPTDGEAALLERYGGELQSLMMSDDPEQDWDDVD